MASFEVLGFDDEIIPDSIEVDCPICQKPIKISLEHMDNSVTCPHCNSEIEIELS